MVLLLAHKVTQHTYAHIRTLSHTVTAMHESFGLTLHELCAPSGTMIRAYQL